MVGMEVCAMHGGKSLKGIGSATFKHGRYSKYLPSGMFGRFKEALGDPALLALDKDVAIVEVRLAELLQAAGEPGADWKAIVEWKDKLEAARKGNDTAALGEALTGLVASITHGNADRERWEEVGEKIELRRKLIDSIHKHEVQAREVLTLEKAMALFTALSHVVRQNVQERDARQRIFDQFTRIMQGQDRGRVLEAMARVEH